MSARNDPANPGQQLLLPVGTPENKPSSVSYPMTPIPKANSESSRVPFASSPLANINRTPKNNVSLGVLDNIALALGRASSVMKTPQKVYSSGNPMILSTSGPIAKSPIRSKAVRQLFKDRVELTPNYRQPSPEVGVMGVPRTSAGIKTKPVEKPRHIPITPLPTAGRQARGGRRVSFSSPVVSRERSYNTCQSPKTLTPDQMSPKREFESPIRQLNPSATYFSGPSKRTCGTQMRVLRFNGGTQTECKCVCHCRKYQRR